jgi:hypothetical protein
VWTVATRRTPESVRDGVAAAIEARGTWTRATASVTAAGQGPSWTFPDGGVQSRGMLRVSAAGASVRIALRVERQSS